VSSSFASKLWLLLALFVQTVFGPALTIHGALPSLAAIVVVRYALRDGMREALLLAAVAGVVTDVLAGTGGGWTFGYLIAAAAVAGVRSRVFAEGTVLTSALVFAAVLVRNAVFWIVMLAEGYPRGYGTRHLHVAVEQAAYTALVCAVVLLIRARFAAPVDRGIQRYA
jgi:rod shape-determining protein MreD